jgi:hypothetical protein
MMCVVAEESLIRRKSAKVGICVLTVHNIHHKYIHTYILSVNPELVKMTVGYE